MQQPHKILVVDDEKSILRVTVRIMQSAGYDVYQAQSGGECLEVIRKNPPDLILLDVGLPDIDGFDICRQIKADPASENIYIAMISGRFTASESQADGLDAGADAFLARPIAKRELLSRVKALLRLKDMENEIKRQKDELGEQVKKLNCLFNISKLRDDPDLSLDKLVEAIIEIIPPAWQHPEITCARIVLGDKNYSTPNFKISPWRQQSTIMVHKKQIGMLEVGYIQKPLGNSDDPFLAEEYSLIRAIGERIGHFIENTRAQMALEHEHRVNEALSKLYMPLIAASSSIGEIGAIIFNHGQRLTGSKHGFVSTIDPETGDNIGYTFEKDTVAQCAIPDAQFPVVMKKDADGTYNGLWGHALNTQKPFYTNAPTKHPSATGLPDGHIPIERLLSVPVLLEHELVGQIALANKTDDYTEQDLEAIGRLAEYYGLAIQRSRAEEALQKAHDNLEQNVKRRTEELLVANSELQRVHDQMVNAHRHRKMLAKELIGLIEKDRDQVAAELHDQVGQTLTSLKMNLETIYDLARVSGSELCTPIKAAGEKTVQIIKDIKSISKGLKPSMIDALGLVPSLRELFSEIQKDTPIKINFFHRNIPQRFERQKELALYRLAQEAMANVIKHSRAQTVYVNLILKNNMLSLTVEDDGVGFDAQKILDPAVSTGSLGVRIMRERATQLDGLFDVESQVGHGTHLMAEIPL